MDKNMLVVSAHAADWCTRAGGTIIKYVQLGYRVTVVVLTYGEHGESSRFWKQNPGGPIEKCKELRNREAAAVAELIGVDIRFMDYGDYPMEMNKERVQLLTDLILDLRPQIVLTHWREDALNMDHEVTSRGVVRAISGAARLGARPNTPGSILPDVFFFESTLPNSEFNHFEINTYIDITDVYEKKIEAVRLFESQPELVPFYRKCAANRGGQAADWARERGRAIPYAEAFYRYLPYVGTRLPLSDL